MEEGMVEMQATVHFLTGDKDFLKSSVEDPRIISVAAFPDM
jgi:hypothetical protein